MMSLGRLASGGARVTVRVVVALIVLTAALCACAGVTSADPLAWGAPTTIDHQSPFGTTVPLDGVSCPTDSFCVATDGGTGGVTAGAGDVLVTADPRGGATAWDVLHVDGTNFVEGASCPSESLCVAGDSAGNIISTDNPGGGVSAWNVTPVAPSTTELVDVSCPTQSFCAAAGFHALYVSSDPTGGPSAWTAIPLGPSNTNSSPTFVSNFKSISCPTSSFCAAVDLDGNVWTSTDPAGGSSAWTMTNIDGDAFMAAIACPTTALCLASDENGNLLVSTDPTGGAGTWSSTQVDTTTEDYLIGLSCPTANFCAAIGLNDDHYTTTQPASAGNWTKTAWSGGPTSASAISCPDLSLCVGVDDSGDALSSPDPTASPPEWTAVNVDGSNEIEAVSCTGPRTCEATDNAGNVLASTDADQATATWNLANVDARNPILSVSCATSSVCLAGTGGRYDGLLTPSGELLASADASSTAAQWSPVQDPADPTDVSGTSCETVSACFALDNQGDLYRPKLGWSPSIDMQDLWTGLSCPAVGLCVAVGIVDGATGVIATSTDPDATRPTWKIVPAAAGFSGVSCPSVGLCVAVGSEHEIATSTDPDGGTAAWSVTAMPTSGDRLTSVSCSSVLLCVAVDTGGNVLSTTTPGSGASTWSAQHLDSEPLMSVSCSSGSICVAGDAIGRVLTAVAPACTAQPVTASSSQPARITLDCTTVDGSAVTYSVVSPPVHGTLTTTRNGTLLGYVPTPGYAGADALAYRATAADGTSNTVIVQITVLGSFIPDHPRISLPEPPAATSAGRRVRLKLHNANPFPIRVDRLIVTAATGWPKPERNQAFARLGKSITVAAGSTQSLEVAVSRPFQSLLRRRQPRGAVLTLLVQAPNQGSAKLKLRVSL